jgi:hypothetical protein
MKKAPIVLFFFLFCAMLASYAASAQERTSLYKTILHMDSVLFDAFNNHQIGVLQNVFSENVEFYHDRDGMGDYKTTISNFKKMFNSTPSLRRDLIAGTLDIYPLPGYGAVEYGEHRFTLIRDGQTFSSVYKFTSIWQWKDGQWKVTRMISVGH